VALQRCPCGLSGASLTAAQARQRSEKGETSESMGTTGADTALLSPSAEGLGGRGARVGQEIDHRPAPRRESRRHGRGAGPSVLP